MNEDMMVCPQCGETFPADETVWFIPPKEVFVCSERCARLAHGLKVN